MASRRRSPIYLLTTNLVARRTDTSTLSRTTPAASHCFRLAKNPDLTTLMPAGFLYVEHRNYTLSRLITTKKLAFIIFVALANSDFSLGFSAVTYFICGFFIFSYININIMIIAITIIITFRVSRRRREMYCGHARLCVCLSVCPRPHAHTIALTRM